MYYCEYNLARSLGVWIFQGNAISPSEWDAHFADIRTLIAGHKTRTTRPAVLLLMLGGTDRPDALKRQELSALTSASGYNPYLALVSRNPLVRGAFSALRWLQKTPNYEGDVFAETAQALSWLETKRGEKLPELLAMSARGQAANDRKKTTR